MLPKEGIHSVVSILIFIVYFCTVITLHVLVFENPFDWHNYVNISNIAHFIPLDYFPQSRLYKRHPKYGKKRNFIIIVEDSVLGRGAQTNGKLMAYACGSLKQRFFKDVI